MLEGIFGRISGEILGGISGKYFNILKASLKKKTEGIFFVEWSKNARWDSWEILEGISRGFFGEIYEQISEGMWPNIRKHSLKDPLRNFRGNLRRRCGQSWKYPRRNCWIRWEIHNEFFGKISGEFLGGIRSNFCSYNFSAYPEYLEESS